MRRNAKVDSNQAKVVDNLRRIGYHVLHIHILKGCCDLIIGKEKRLCYVELKASDKLPKKFFDMPQQDKDKYLETKLTAHEKAFKQQIGAFDLPYIIAISAEEIDKKFKQLGK